MGSTRPSRYRRAAAALLLAAGAVTVAAVTVRTAAGYTDRTTSARVDAIRSSATGGPPAPIAAADLAGLPNPVRRYLEAALGDERRRVETARIDQRGEFRLGGASGSWKPFAATQHVGARPPAFLWDASIEVLPFLPVRVVDAYEDGVGTLTARLCSAVTVAAAGPSPEMAEAELQRYLAEAVWYPSALLADAVEWEPIDDRSARATIEDGPHAATLVFRFDDQDLVESVHADARYRQEVDDDAPWTGHFGDYRERNGMLVPMAASVEWNLPEGDQPYWRASVESIEHDFAEGSV